VAVRGAGGDFCAGMDLNELLASADKSVAENRQAALHFAEIFVRMRRTPKRSWPSCRVERSPGDAD